MRRLPALPLKSVLLNTSRIELWPADLLRARSNADARVLAGAYAVLRRKQDGRYLAASESMAAFYGRPPDQVIGHSDTELLDPTLGAAMRAADQTALAHGRQLSSEHRFDWRDAKHDWEEYWAAQSEGLQQYLKEAAAIQSEPVPPSSGSAKLSTIRQKLNKIRALNKQWGCPEEPWAAVSANLLWNIANIPAAQISMIGKLHGASVAPVAACSTFSITLKMAVDAMKGDSRPFQAAALARLPMQWPMIRAAHAAARSSR